MKKYESHKFAKLMAIAGARHNKNLSEAVIEDYWQALQRFDFVAVEHALQTHRDNPDGGQFLPTPADIIRLLGGSGEDRALIAWAKVDKAIPTVGSYTSVVFDDALIHAVIEDMGGWIRLCKTTTEQLIFSGLEFQKRYRGLLTQPPKRYPKVLIGRITAENSGDACSLLPPTFITLASLSQRKNRRQLTNQSVDKKIKRLLSR